MLCTRCRSLSDRLRRAFHGSAPPPHEPGILRALRCERCGAPAPLVRAHSFPETLLRLERAGLGIAGPLLRAPPDAA